MVIQFQPTNILNPYIRGEINNRQEESNEDKTTVHTGKLLSQQETNQKSQTEKLYEQIERTKETIKSVKENEKLSSKIKQEKVEQLEKDMQELQKQLIEVQHQEQEEKLKEEQEKKEKEKMKELTPEEREKKVYEAQGKMIAGIAVAADKLQEAMPAYHKVKEYTTQAKLGMGPKYGGNLSISEVQGLSMKAASYGKNMMKSLNEAEEAMNSIGKEVEVYTQYNKKDKEEDEKDLGEKVETSHNLY